jgi:hypothetical protein
MLVQVPYVKIDMHPEDGKSYLDAIFFSPHNFLADLELAGFI